CRRWKGLIRSWWSWRRGARIESQPPPQVHDGVSAQQHEVATASEPPHSKRAGRLNASASILPQLRHLGRWDPLPPMWLEGRFSFEFLRLIRDPVFRGDDVPPGLRKPVLLIPGFLSVYLTLCTTRDWLKRIGYCPRPASLPFTVMYSEVMIRPLPHKLLAH